MKFSIITTTYKRPIELLRAINSVLLQDYKHWEMIIVNDSPDFDYSSIEKSDILKDERIKYFKNGENKGLNYARNIALVNISADSNYTIILDDDDYFNTECLSEATKIIKENPNYNWYVSNRTYENGDKITINGTNRNTIDYIIDYLIFKRFRGDATHIISTKYKSIRFPKKVKQEEQWMYFAQIQEKFYYYNFNSTISKSYSDLGLTKAHKSIKTKLDYTFESYKELFSLNFFNPLIWFIYLPLKMVAIILKN